MNVNNVYNTIEKVMNSLKNKINMICIQCLVNFKTNCTTLTLKERCM